ncbi:hypothetical protein F5Y09DRAFT_348580 [Xylaria sp. FL1042]|nr:hypothetical protein F5Y09DRAFT_348580 [Xylaria sp. FL1042]
MRVRTVKWFGVYTCSMIAAWVSLTATARRFGTVGTRWTVMRGEAVRCACVIDGGGEQLKHSKVPMHSDPATVMASTTAFSLEAAKKSLYEEGFLDLNDPEVGKLVSEMEQRGFPYLSPYGLDYCKQYALNDTVKTPDTFYSYYLMPLSVSDLLSNPSSAGAALKGLKCEP